jgi:hypothetical protein
VNVARTSSLSRRAALAAAVGAVAAGTACTPNSANRRSDREPSARAAEPLPDVTLAATVVADEQDLLDRIDATLDRHPRLARVLADAREAHSAHVALLEDAAPDPTSASPGETPSAEGSPTAPRPPRVPADPARALRAIARREDELSLVDKRSAFAAESGAFARVLASMAASAAQQAVVLRAAVVPRGDA